MKEGYDYDPEMLHPEFTNEDGGLYRSKESFQRQADLHAGAGGTVGLWDVVAMVVFSLLILALLLVIVLSAFSPIV